MLHLRRCYNGLSLSGTFRGWDTCVLYAGDRNLSGGQRVSCGGLNNDHKDVHVLIPRTCEYITYMATGVLQL